MSKKYKILLAALGFACCINWAQAQTTGIYGTVKDEMGKPLAQVSISVKNLHLVTATDSAGIFTLGLPSGSWDVEARLLGYNTSRLPIQISSQQVRIDFRLERSEATSVNEVVVSATMKEVSKLDSPVPVEIYTSKFFRANPTPSLFDALQTINGVKPQLNCNICNTGDIHINGLEGPYTMILIDGMPLVSGLSTVYGLSGIPQSLIDRVEIVKGPASTLYGSEAVGGLVNIITKKPERVPLIAADVFSTNWKEINVDLSAKFRMGSRVQNLLGINYFNYQNPTDNNNDNFTDVTLQHRISIFNKLALNRPNNRAFTLAGRYVYEDRWGGEMNFSKKHRGGNEVYGESIYTQRWELFGTYQLPFAEKIIFQFSTNGHRQNSMYGTLPFLADQYIAFGQLAWHTAADHHDILAGISNRFTYYDDNTPATADMDSNQASKLMLPGIFVQDEITFSQQHKVLLGIRFDYNNLHGSILSPRLNYKWTSQDEHSILRISAGNGYRVANVFTEDHAALTGARKVVFTENLLPETSWNGNINYVKKISLPNGEIELDGSIFYTHFSNKIIPDYESNPNEIRYGNLQGYAISKGLSMNVNLNYHNGLKLLAGFTAMDVYQRSGGTKSSQFFAEKFTGTWNIGYRFARRQVSIDYTGNLYGPMRLPLLNAQDPRRAKSDLWSIQNIQVTKGLGEWFEIYGGIKNLLNWTPNRGNPFIIARAHDPFDKKVQFDGAGQAIATPENPYGLTFDPTYVYGPNQGIRGFIGVRYTLR